MAKSHHIEEVRDVAKMRWATAGIIMAVGFAVALVVLALQGRLNARELAQAAGAAAVIGAPKPKLR